jgi:hypothetical protein
VGELGGFGIPASIACVIFAQHMNKKHTANMAQYERKNVAKWCGMLCPDYRLLNRV